MKPMCRLVKIEVGVLVVLFDAALLWLMFWISISVKDNAPIVQQVAALIAFVALLILAGIVAGISIEAASGNQWKKNKRNKQQKGGYR